MITFILVCSALYCVTRSSHWCQLDRSLSDRFGRHSCQCWHLLRGLLCLLFLLRLRKSCSQAHRLCCSSTCSFRRRAASLVSTSNRFSMSTLAIVPSSRAFCRPSKLFSAIATRSGYWLGTHLKGAELSFDFCFFGVEINILACILDLFRSTQSV